MYMSARVMRPTWGHYYSKKKLKSKFGGYCRILDSVACMLALKNLSKKLNHGISKMRLCGFWFLRLFKFSSPIILSIQSLWCTPWSASTRYWIRSEIFHSRVPCPCSIYLRFNTSNIVGRYDELILRRHGDVGSSYDRIIHSCRLLSTLTKFLMISFGIFIFEQLNQTFLLLTCKSFTCINL